uniref:Zinc finger, HIT type 6 n=1 Tax=Mus musculus TaxID=10090 RepID=A0A0G2JE59_MOUSE
MDAAPIKEEGSLKSEAMEDAKVKEEPQMNPRVGSKRKLALSRYRAASCLFLQFALCKETQS